MDAGVLSGVVQLRLGRRSFLSYHGSPNCQLDLDVLEEVRAGPATTLLQILCCNAQCYLEEIAYLIAGAADSA